MRTVAAVVFDLDGVLIDSEPLHLLAIQAALGPRSRSYTERDHRTFFGATDEEIFRILRILFDLDLPTEDLVTAKRDHLVRIIRTRGRPMPGVPEVPRHLGAAGLALGVVSVSPRPIIAAVLDTVGLADVFRVIVCGDEIARGKPAPDAYLMAARRLGLSPETCLAVEHSRDGVLAARAAGMTVAAIPCDATSHEDFTPADLVLPSLDALPKALGHHLEAGSPTDRPARVRPEAR